jgi:thymidylate synthase
MSLRNLSTTLLAYERCRQSYVLSEGTEAECRTWDGAQLVYDGKFGVLPNVPARKLNLTYAVQEFLWYCRGDRQDSSILEHATMWKKLQQKDGGFNSNYGQYIFKPYATPEGVKHSQFDQVVDELVANPDSRRSCMVLLNPWHLYSSNSDIVCTYALQFFIRDDALDMHVFMRSNDVVWGLTNDAFCFNMIQRMVCAALRIRQYPLLQVGSYTHNAGTLHVYKRHYGLVRDAQFEASKYEEINPPLIDEKDLEALRFDPKLLHGGDFVKWVQDVTKS